MKGKIRKWERNKISYASNPSEAVYLQLELHPIPELNWGKWGMGWNSDQLGRQIFREEMQAEGRLSIDAKHVWIGS